jgi:Tripartite tricarboxylate transporter family receptor
MGLRVLAQNSALTFRVVLDPQSVSYDALRDLVAFGIAWRTPSVLVVRSDSPYRSFAELIDYSKEESGLDTDLPRRPAPRVAPRPGSVVSRLRLVRCPRFSNPL